MIRYAIPHPRHDGDMHEEDIEVRGYFVLQPDVSTHVNATRVVSKRYFG